MKLVHCEISGILLNDNTDFTEWIMESPEVFSEYVQELNEQVLGAEGRFVLSEKDKEIDLSKKADIIFNPFTVEVNSRKVLSRLYAELSNIAKNEQMFVKTAEFLKIVQKYMLDLEHCTDYILEFDSELNITDLLKAINLRYETQYINFHDKLMQYIKVMASVGAKIFVFVNIRNYLKDDILQEMIKEMKYLNLQGLLIESVQKNSLEGVNQYVIDKDKCELY